MWRATRHHLGARILPRSPDGTRIARALGIRRLKSDQRCAACHYTLKQTGTSPPKAIAGASCESCHGAASGWLEVHDDYGAGQSAAAETRVHRIARLSECDAQGMKRADRLYQLASQCYRCHVIGNEEVVNRGGHPLPSGFELVSWSQGTMRHNFVRGKGETNAESSLPRRRVMFALGRMLELEYALRALAAASEQGPFSEAMIELASGAIEELERLNAIVATPEMEEILTAARGLALATGRGEEVGPAAARVAAAAQRFAENHDGTALVALDALLPPRDSYRGLAGSASPAVPLRASSQEARSWRD